MPHSGSLSSSGWNFDNSYIRLSEILYARQLPTLVTAPETILYNASLGASLGLSADLTDPNRTRFFSAICFHPEPRIPNITEASDSASNPASGVA